jgi:hypothetical protein
MLYKQYKIPFQASRMCASQTFISCALIINVPVSALSNPLRQSLAIPKRRAGTLLLAATRVNEINWLTRPFSLAVANWRQ